MTDTTWIAFKNVAADLDALLVHARELRSDERQATLLLLLDRLEIACLQLPATDVDDQDGRSPNTHDQRRAAVAAAFPEFGYYHLMRPAPANEAAESSIGDAVDDLAEIMRDIDDALWTGVAQTQTNAIWQAKFNYEHHLGSHLADPLVSLSPPLLWTVG